MFQHSLASRLLALACVGSLLSCSTAVPGQSPSEAAQNGTPALPAGLIQPDLATRYAALAANGGRLYQIDAAASQLRMYAFRAGRLARLGHNHVLSAPQFNGYVYVPGSLSEARFELEFRLDQLTLDDPQQRAALGPAFASVVSPEAIASTREHMLGEDNLQADRFPLVRIRALQITGEAPRLAARIAVDMHGQSHEQWVALNVQGLPERLSVSGSLVLRQSDFGIHPYSVMAGAMAVQDEVIVEFQLTGK